MSELKVVIDENDNFELLDFIEFEKDLIYNKFINNINCGILLSIDKPIEFPDDYEKVRKIKKSDDEKDIFHALTTIDDITVKFIYLKNNPENIQGYSLLEHCLEEYCLQKFLDDAEWEEWFGDSFEEIPDCLYETL